MAKADLPQLAEAVAKGLASPAARQEILAAMRASTAVEHRLVLADYLRSGAGAGLLDGSAKASGRSRGEFMSWVDSLRLVTEVAIAVPLREHRLAWRGGGRIGVAGTWNPEALGFWVYEPDGSRRRAMAPSAVQDYDAFFIIRPLENVGTRIDRQDDVPGPVIQDPDDGETAMIWTLEVEGEPPVAVDYGRYETEAALERAFAVAMSGLAADGSECDDDCPIDGGGGGGGAGGGDDDDDAPEVRPSPTTLHGYKLVFPTEWPLHEEIDVTVGYRNRDGAHVRGTLRYEGIRHGGWYPLDADEILPVSPIAGGPRFYVKAVETDWLFDDHLGTAWFTADSRQGRRYLSSQFIVDLRW